MINLIIAVIIAYLVGSIPFGYLAGKLLKGTDIRKHGSGNIGATNVFRTVGKIPGICVLSLDMAKGYFAAGFLAQLFLNYGVAAGDNLFRIMLGVSCVCGHTWTVFLKFKGGKGVATAFGVMMALAPKCIGAGMLLWLCVFVLSHYVSLSSIAAAVSLPVFALFFKEPREFIILVIVLSALIVYRHIPNIRRLMKGEEPKLAVFSSKKS
ncbi:MAG: glycerol-3-phosphate 1-O-acyltransferase PlsY [Candidatus Omnitrophota bacterium]